MNYRHSMSGW